MDAGFWPQARSNAQAAPMAVATRRVRIGEDLLVCVRNCSKTEDPGPRTGDASRSSLRSALSSVALFSHSPQNLPRPHFDAPRMPNGVEDPWRRDDRGQGRRLALVELRGALAEVAAGGRLGAVSALSEFDDVEIELEDPPLREVPLESFRNCPLP